MVSPVSGSNLISYYSGQAALSLLGSSSSSSSATTTNAANTLLSYYEQKEGIGGTSSTSQTATNKAPTAPWQDSGTPSPASAVQNAVNGQAFINPGAAQLNAPAGVSSEDYRNLFALYQGLNSLYDIATAAASASSTSAGSAIANITPTQLQAAFSSGMSQVENFLSNDPFSEFNLTSGSVNTQEESNVGIPNGTSSSYTTGVIATGDEAVPLQALEGNVQFNISVQSQYATVNTKNAQGQTVQVLPPPVQIPINLNNMGSTPRTIDNVVNYINSQLQAADVSTTFAAANLGSTGTTTTLPNGQTETTAGTTEWGLTVTPGSGETVSFSAPSTAAAVYVSGLTGGASTWSTSSSASSTSSSSSSSIPTQTTTATGQQLVKLQTGNNVVGTQPPTITNAGSTNGLSSGQVFADTLPSGVSQVTASATAADGTVYELANASGSVNGAPIQGGQGVVLLQYDPSGKLLSTKVVAGLQNAIGASVAVGADGTVAVAGANTTNATTNSSGVPVASTTSAFVQVYDPSGNPTWSQTVPAVGGSAVATGVAIGSDDSVYLTGNTTGSVGNQIPQGTTDEFIQGFTSTGTATFTQQYGAVGGTNASAGIVYDSANNTLYTAGVENSQAVVRSFALNTTTTGTGAKAKTTTTATAGATRNLGFVTGLAGIGLSGNQVVVGGTTNAATVHAGTVTQAYKGVSDAFIASIDSSLTPTSNDNVAYLGLSGATQVATAMTVAGGQAYITGTVANDPSSVETDSNATEGFVTGVNTSTGAVSYSTKLAGANGQSAPSAISVSTTGSSILDQLGLPQGAVNPIQSDLITSATSIKAGSSFWVRTSPGGAQTQITVTATDTLSTLVNKINTAIAGQGTAKVVPMGSKSELSITPNDSNSYIELDAQQASDMDPGASSQALSNNVLSQLGLSSGVIRQVQTINGLTNVNQLREYGLNLPTNLDISTASNAQSAANALQAAMTFVQQAYQDLANPPTIASEAAAAAKTTSGSVPTYLTNEIANLQAGLKRLTAGQSSSSSNSAKSTSALLSSLIT